MGKDKQKKMDSNNPDIVSTEPADVFGPDYHADVNPNMTSDEDLTDEEREARKANDRNM